MGEILNIVHLKKCASCPKRALFMPKGRHVQLYGMSQDSDVTDTLNLIAVIIFFHVSGNDAVIISTLRQGRNGNLP